MTPNPLTLLPVRSEVYAPDPWVRKDCNCFQEMTLMAGGGSRVGGRGQGSEGGEMAQMAESTWPYVIIQSLVIRGFAASACFSLGTLTCWMFPVSMRSPGHTERPHLGALIAAQIKLSFKSSQPMTQICDRSLQMTSVSRCLNHIPAINMFLIP